MGRPRSRRARRTGRRPEHHRRADLKPNPPRRRAAGSAAQRVRPVPRRPDQRPAGPHHRLAHRPDHRPRPDGRRRRRTRRPDHHLGPAVGRQNRTGHRRPRRPPRPRRRPLHQELAGVPHPGIRHPRRQPRTHHHLGPHLRGDAAAAQRRIDDMAHSVCPDDPRTLDDRRIEAYTALLAGITTLTCHCGNDDCEATAAPRPGRDTTIYVLTDTTTGNTPAADQADQNTRDRNEAEPATDTTGKAKNENEAAREGEREDAAASEDRDGTEQTPAAKQNVRPHTAQCRSAYVFGAGLAPTALLEAMCEGATIREITHPGPDSAPEPRYTPSPALAAYIRCRDLTCRFPHCDTPATLADIDHTVPYPVGPTHPSNLKTLCRFHHLLKTFWLGATGWRDRQYPDGTIEWTAPTGHTYTTYPGSRLLFPALCAPTATLWTGEPPQTTLSARRGAMMPKRRNTRAHNRSRYIEAQRRRNRSEKICTTRSTDIARGRDILYRNTLHQFHPPGHEPDYGNDPPPF
ncbi:HNH endonuclease [Mycolicibacterium vanbaalenii PYR-1]|uniref:HNH endonuclease n=1 Tax=Mycolicibacterium vanbaalenii (strain DSM 7251 / JCM 13017 / BCRC 16820 / KCTC 9966 / NRRL B-24157 / PYR-1) TaxID=350058 RepID=A1TH89_MYCVP|nr:HNH endonuclease [Mycolicibacterium vanbaalenii PYR-1]